MLLHRWGWAALLGFLSLVASACSPAYVYKYKLDDSDPGSFCSTLKYDSRAPRQRERSLRVLRRWLGLRIQAEVLDSQQVARAGGVPIDPSAGYGRRVRMLGTTLSVERAGVKVDLTFAELGGGYKSRSRYDWAFFYGLFGAKLSTLPRDVLPWPQDPLSGCRAKKRSGWQIAEDLFTLVGHVATLGIFLWGPKLAGYGGWLSGDMPAEKNLAATLVLADQAESEPHRRAAERFQSALERCRPTPGGSCVLYSVFSPDESGRRDGHKDMLRLGLKYHFEDNCWLEDYADVPLPPGDDPEAQLAALFPAGSRPLDELFPDRAPGEAAPVPGPPLLPLPAVASLPPAPLPPGPLTVRLLDRAASQRVLGLPLRPVPDALLYTCRVGSTTCQLRVESTAGTWVDAAPTEELASGLLYGDLRSDSLLGESLPTLLLGSLKHVTQGAAAPLSLLRHVPDHHQHETDRVMIMMQQGSQWRLSSYPLPPGTDLAVRIRRALDPAGMPAGHAAPMDPAAERRACDLADGAACLALAQRGDATLLERACTLGEGVACRTGALRSPQPRHLLKRGCLLGDVESCGELARRPLLPEILLLDAEGESASAYGLACGAGMGWACNDLAVLIGRVVEHDTENASLSRSRKIMRQLVDRACQRGEPIACANRNIVAPDEGRLDGLRLIHPIVPSR